MNILCVCSDYCDFSLQPSQFSADIVGWWAQVESNHRPHAYQACALTFWAMSPYCLAQPRSTFDLQSNSYEPRFRFCNRWWRWRESNPWPPACRAGALPAELHPHIWVFVFQQSLEIEQQLNARIVSTSSVLFLCELRKIIFQSLLFSIERRWSSRTFRYGYLVTT